MSCAFGQQVRTQSYFRRIDLAQPGHGVPAAQAPPADDDSNWHVPHLPFSNFTDYWDAATGKLTPSGEPGEQDGAGAFLGPSADGSGLYAVAGPGAAAFEIEASGGRPGRPGRPGEAGK